MTFVFVALQQTLHGQTEADVGIGSMTLRINQIYLTESSNTVVYPQEYNVYGSMGSVYGGGFVIAARDFKTNLIHDPQKGWTHVEQSTTVPYFACEASTRYYNDTQHSTVPVDFNRYWKYKAPTRIVNGINFSNPDWQVFDKVGGPNMVYEQTVVASCNTAMGITLTQRAYAFGNPAYDDFILVEYVFKNTGNINEDAKIEYPQNEVKQCYIGLHFVPQPTGLTSRIIAQAGGWNAPVDDWLDHYLGNFGGEPIRVIYGWDGDAAASFYSMDDEGDPLPASGIFMSPQYPGMAILHADRATDNHANDPNQPVMSYYSYGGAFTTNALSIGASGIGVEAVYKTLSNPGFFVHPFNWETWNATRNEAWAMDNNPNREHFKVGTMGFGPYQFVHVGDSVRIVACYAVGSMGWNKAVDIGKKWKDEKISKTDKNVWLRSGRDSLFTKVGRVSKLFKDASGNFNLSKGAGLIDAPPQTPDLTVRSDKRAILLEWNNTGAAEYRIYRRLQPTFDLQNPVPPNAEDPGLEIYPLIAKTGPGSTGYRDASVVTGQSYWYCITAVNGKGIESSRFLTRTDPTASNLQRGSASPYAMVPPTAMDSIYVYPNPFHIKSSQFYNAFNIPPGTIVFVGLPAQCRIRVYTQDANLVATIQHDLKTPPSSTERWEMLNRLDQYIASGLYVFVVDQTKDHLGQDLGLSKIGKLAVIR